MGFDAEASFLKKKAEDPDNRAIVTEALRQLTGRRAGACPMSCARSSTTRRRGRRRGGYTEEEWVARFMESSTPRSSPEPEPAAGERERRVTMPQQPRSANMQQMLQQVQKMQQDMETAQEELKRRDRRGLRRRRHGDRDGRGDLEVKAVKIDPAAVDPEDVEMLADMVARGRQRGAAHGPGAGGQQAGRRHRRTGPRRPRRAGTARLWQHSPTALEHLTLRPSSGS